MNKYVKKLRTCFNGLNSVKILRDSAPTLLQERARDIALRALASYAFAAPKEHRKAVRKAKASLRSLAIERRTPLAFRPDLLLLSLQPRSEWENSLYPEMLDQLTPKIEYTTTIQGGEIVRFTAVDDPFQATVYGEPVGIG